MKKRACFVFLTCLIALMLVFSLGACRSSKPKKSLAFALKGDDTYEVTAIGTCTDVNLIIPAQYKGKAVTSIGAGAFRDNLTLTSVILPASVTAVKENAFSGCAKLENVTLSSDLQSIGAGAFASCVALSSVTVPATVISIKESAFDGCAALSAVRFSEGSLLANIGDHAFRNCPIQDATVPAAAALQIPHAALKTLSVNAGTTIAESAFAGCAFLTTLTIADSVTTIGANAFDACAELTQISLPASLTAIGASAFSGCGKLAAVSFSDQVSSIGESAFCNCVSLTSVTLPTKVTAVEAQTFSGCEGLDSVTFSGSVTTIGASAFSGCTALTTISLPATLKTIGASAFRSCGLQALSIPAGVNAIGNGAFSLCSGLTSVMIPESVTSIGEYCFYGCASLSFNEYDNVLYLGNEANRYLVLYKAKNVFLDQCEIPSSVKMICDSAFAGCFDLTSVTLPEGVVSIGKFAFQGSGLTSVSIPDGVRVIDGCTFYECSDLQTVLISSGVEVIGASAFAESGLTSVVIAENSKLTAIEEDAFENCSALSSITFHGSEVDWNAIEKDPTWDRNAGAYALHFDE